MKSVLKIVSALKAMSLPKARNEEEKCSDFVPMVELCHGHLQSVAGGTGVVVSGTPRGGW